MGLARKTALVIAGLLLVLVGVVAALSLTLVMGGFEELERRFALRNLDRLREAVVDLRTNLDTKASDWASWDDTYVYMAERDPAFIESNLSSESVGLLGLCAMVFLDEQQRTILHAGHDPEASGTVPADPAVLEAIAAEPSLWVPPPVGSSRHGLLRVRDGVVVVAIRPILTSQGLGPARGSLVFARRLDEGVRTRLEELIRVGVTWEVADQQAAPGPAVLKVEGRSILASGLLTDLRARPVLRCTITADRAISRQGWQMVKLLLLVVVATGLALGLATDRALRVLVLSRVARLSAELGEVARTGRSSLRVTAEGRDELGRLAHGANRVLEALERNERELRRAREEAEAATRAKSGFLAAISHEVRSPLAVVVGSAEMLGDGSLTEEERVRTLEAVARNVRHALVVVNDLLDHSKIEAGRMSLERIAFSPREVVEESMAMVERAAAAKGLALRSDVGASVPDVVVGDPTRLRQILVNLLGNAVKFTAHGWIEVRASARRVAQGTRLRVEVEDTGIGLSPEQIAGLFEAYTQAETTTARRFGGTGLGLSISRSLARQMGGDLSASGRLGAGATFTVEIECGSVRAPGAEAETGCPDADADGSVPRADAGVLSGLRVLVADDDPDSRRLLVHHLTRHGARVVEAPDGAAAVRAAGEGGRFDAVLLDRNMPGMDGPEAARSLRRAGYAGHLIAATAAEETTKDDASGGALFDLVLIKPIPPRALVEAVLAVSRGARRSAA